VAQLWEVLAEPAAACGVAPLTPAVKDALWQTLLASEQDVRFAIPGCAAAAPPPACCPAPPPPAHRRRPSTLTRRDPPAAAQTKGKGKAKAKPKKKRRGSDSDASDGSDSEGGGGGGAAPAVEQPVPRGDPRLLSPEAAAAGGVAVLASSHLQDGAVGLFDAHLTRFPLSEVQRRVLGIVGASGARGALQSEMASHVGIDNRNFFYVVKARRRLRCMWRPAPAAPLRGRAALRALHVLPLVVPPASPAQSPPPVPALPAHRPFSRPDWRRAAVQNLEQRGLVTKRPAVMHSARASASNRHATHVQTNIIHLAKFAPEGLAAGARVTDGRATTAGGALALPGGAGGEGEDALGFLDDESQFARICGQLQAMGGTAVESDLKVALGFRGARGHRMWRLLRAALVKRGNVAEGLAQLPAGDGGAGEVDALDLGGEGPGSPRTVKCMRLIRGWEAAPVEAEEEEEAGGGWWAALAAPPLPGGSHGPVDTVGGQVAEVTLDRQLLQLIGSGGAPRVACPGGGGAGGASPRLPASRAHLLSAPCNCNVSAPVPPRPLDPAANLCAPLLPVPLPLPPPQAPPA
jgi:hypothetical protein